MAIKIKIVADYDQRGMSKATKALDNFAKQAQIALGAVAVATAALAVKSVQEFAKFEGAMTKSLAIMGNVSDQMRGEMQDAAREMAKTTTFSAEQAADSYFFLASAGLDAEASVAALPRVASFAQAGMFDMARATDLLTDAQSALGLTIRDDAIANMENMARVSDVLVKANTLANASVEQFSTSLTTKAGASLRALGKDVEEGVAVLAAFADQGIKGELAGTQLSIVLRDLTTKAIDNKKAFEEAGISIFDSNGEMQNMGDIIADLEVALAGMSDETRKATLLQLGFSDRSLGSLQALLGTSDAIKLYEEELRKAAGTTDEISQKQLESFNSQLALLESALIDVFIEIGEQLTPALKDLVEQVRDLLPEIGTKLVEAIKKVDFAKIVEDFGNFVILVVENLETIGKVAGLLLGAAAALATYRIATQLATTATALFNSTLVLNPIGLLVTGLGFAVIGFKNYSDALHEVKVDTEGLTDKQIEQAEQIERLRKLQKQYEYALENSNASSKQLAEDGLSRVRDELARVEYALQTTAGEINRFNNLRIAPKLDLSSWMEEVNRVDTSSLAGILEASGVGSVADLVGDGDSGSGGGGGGGKSAFQIARERTQELIKDSQKQLRDAQIGYNEATKAANQNYADSVARLQREFGNKLAGIIQQSQNRLRDAFKSAVQVNLSTLFEGEEEKSVAGLVAGLRNKLEASRSLLSNSAELASAGFSQTFIEQVVAAGTETGNELAKAILQSTPETQRELQELFVALEETSNSGMDSLAASIYEKQGLATQALKDLYVTTQIELDEALLDQQDQLQQALIAANETFVEAVTEIKNTLAENLAEMEDGFGGMERTIKQFMDRLDQVIAKYRDLQSLSELEAAIETMPEPVRGGGPTISFQPEPVYQPPRSEPVINVNVKTDSTQSPAQVGAQVAKTVQKYFAGGGGIKVIAL